MSSDSLFPASMAHAFTAEALSRGREQRDHFRLHQAPSSADPMSRNTRRSVPEGYNGQAPDDLKHFAEWFESQPDARDRFRWVLRDALDELMDGGRTGRWAYQQLRAKTEKAHFGTTVEVKLTQEFDIPGGEDIDWRIHGEDIDCKFSKDFGGWEIPMEMYRCADHGSRASSIDHPALLVWMSDDRSQWAAGLIRTSDDVLAFTQEGTRAYNGDRKRKLGAEALDVIHWLWGGLQRDLPGNLLLHMDPAVRDKILVPGSSGQERVTALFRLVQHRIIGRQVVVTLGQQSDPAKRVRDARLALFGEGVIILGHQGVHAQIAQSLELPKPVKGEWMSIRVVPVSETEPRPKFLFEDSWWALAAPDDSTAALPAPPKKLPRNPRTRQAVAEGNDETDE